MPPASPSSPEKHLRRLLEMLHFYSDSLARIPLSSEEEVSRVAVTMMASILGYETALLVFEPEVWPEARGAMRGRRREELDGEASRLLLDFLRAEVDAPVHLEQETASPVARQVLERLELGSLALIVPLRATVNYREERVGFALVARPRRTADPNADLTVLDIVASLVTGALSACRARQELVTLNQMLEQEVLERRRAEQALHFLSEVAAALSETPERGDLAEKLARLSVPRFADWCAVLLGPAADRLQLTALVHREPTREEALRARLQQLPAGNLPHLHGRVLRTGEPELLETVDAPELEALAGEWELASALSVPLVTQGNLLGALVFAVGPSRTPYRTEDLMLAQELARRTALALDRAELLETARQAQVRAEQASRAKDEFLAIVSHELRTPLTSVLSWTQMLRAGRLPANKQDKALEAIERNARVQKNLTEDLLDVSRITRGTLRLDLRPLEPLHPVEQALEVVRPTAVAKGVQIHASLDRRAGSILGDPERLQQIVWNLLTNAIKFTPTGGAVHLALRRSGATVELEVRDTGEGITADFLPFLFERFRQADSSSSRSYGGLGLGLAIVRHLVELHGGRIEAASPGVGQGATFTVRLPLLSAPPAPARAARAGADVLSKGLLSLDGVHVLVVEDEPETREQLALVLEQCRAHVTVASSAHEAFSLFRQGSPDVFVSGFGMPGGDGDNLIHRVRALAAADGGRTPAVALTAFPGAEEARTRALQVGFNDHAVKPIDPVELVTVVASLVGRVGGPGPGVPPVPAGGIGPQKK